MDEQKFLEVIELIFGKLAVRYGATWLRQWDGVKMELVKGDWAEELAGFASNLEPLRYALRNLPDRCPNVTEFRAIANRCPPPVCAALPLPQTDRAVVSKAIEQAKAVTTAKVQTHDPKKWARDILTRHQAGDRLSPISVQFARCALGLVA